jgi:hypothetical protein
VWSVNDVPGKDNVQPLQLKGQLVLSVS